MDATALLIRQAASCVHYIPVQFPKVPRFLALVECCPAQKCFGTRVPWISSTFEGSDISSVEGNLTESDQLIGNVCIWLHCANGQENALASELAKETPNSGGYFLNCSLLLCYSSNLHSAVSSWQPEPLWLCAIHGLEIRQKSKSVQKWFWNLSCLPST